jgi:hypothetical protein
MLECITEEKKAMTGKTCLGLMRIPLAVAVGFEPTVGFPPHTLSRRAP